MIKIGIKKKGREKIVDELYIGKRRNIIGLIKRGICRKKERKREKKLIER